MSEKPKLYKVLQGTSAILQDFDYAPFVPRNAKPGKWTPLVKGALRRCGNGYHLTTDVAYWITWPDHTPVVYEAEGKGERVYARPDADNKRVFRSIRLIRRVPRSKWHAAWRAARRKVL